MAPVALKRLIAVQNVRMEEIDSMGVRLRERDRNTLNVKILQSRFDAINGIWSKSRKTHAEIVARDDAEQDAYITDNLFTRMQTAYEYTLDYISTLMTEFETANQVNGRVRPADESIDDSNSRPAKLPKLDLPKFSGRYEEWGSFCDLFTTLVHEAPRVADATKLQYSKTCLTGPAADLLSDVNTTNANYASTWLALKKRYDKPRLMVSNHLNALMNMAFLKKESAAELRAVADEAQGIVRALANLKMPVSHWDIWFVHRLSARSDSDSKKAWKSELNTKDRRTLLNANRGAAEPDLLAVFPKFEEFTGFLERRYETLTMISIDSKNGEECSSSAKPTPAARRVFHTRPSGCAFCPENHYLSKCPKFLAKSPFERRDEIRRLRLCFNCMGAHMFREYKSRGRCKVCKDKHHSLLHYHSKPAPPQSDTNAPVDDPHDETRGEKSATLSLGVNAFTTAASAPRGSVILATAQVNVLSPNGTYTSVRVLLDQGSEPSFISEAIVQLLGLPKRRVQVPLTGLGTCTAGTARFETQFTLKSLIDPDFTLDTEALGLPRLTSQLPARHLVEFSFEHLRGLPLADPQLHVPESVDFILGADVGLLLRPGLQNIFSSKLTAQNTVLGWIISGPLQPSLSRRAEPSPREPLRALHCTSDQTLHQVLQRFWKLEEVPRPSCTLKPDEEACEGQFIETHQREKNSRYIVKLPLKNDLPEVANETRRMPSGSLAHMQHRFAHDPRLALGYRDFMRTYEELGHMRRIPPNELENPRSWYLPHHAVIQSTPSNWKLRVVFDASRRTREQYCLNDFLMTGPPLQRELSLVLLNWRQYQFAFTADIVKMFRQISIARNDQDLHRIVRAPNPGEAPVEYRLTTVTYGMAYAPYLAIITLAQLAIDKKSRFPLGSDCLESNTYVDDIFVGADELALAIRKRTELVELLRSARIELDKWASNHEGLFPPHMTHNTSATPIQIDRHDFVKTLGIQWNPHLDNFSFSTVPFEGLSGRVTKRSVLSSISRIFDPLGWLSPITVTAKILMQDLWILKCEWDTALPIDAKNRWLGLSSNLSCQLHGYADASSRAYAAVVYLRIDDGKGHVLTSLLAAKSKVALVKTVSIPNLELCGAVLLVTLVCHIPKLNFLKASPMFMWSDSQTVLTWLNKHPCHWKNFVANRVSLIQTELPSAVWAHVPTADNPADIATRGCKPIELKHSDLWWHGPSWLSSHAENWPCPPEAVRATHAQTVSVEPDILCQFASLTRLIRVVAYCLRPLVNLRRRKGWLNPLTTSLTVSELSQARLVVMRLAQSHAFAMKIML